MTKEEQLVVSFAKVYSQELRGMRTEAEAKTVCYNLITEYFLEIGGANFARMAREGKMPLL